MEQILLSCPAIHTDWDGDQGDIGFIHPSSSESVTPCGNGETNDRGDPNILSLSLGEISPENAYQLDKLFWTPSYSEAEQSFSWKEDVHGHSNPSCSQVFPLTVDGQCQEDNARTDNANLVILNNCQLWNRDSTDTPKRKPLSLHSLISNSTFSNAKHNVERVPRPSKYTQGDACIQTLLHIPGQDTQQVCQQGHFEKASQYTEVKHDIPSACKETSNKQMVGSLDDIEKSREQSQLWLEGLTSEQMHDDILPNWMFNDHTFDSELGVEEQHLLKVEYSTVAASPIHPMYRVGRSIPVTVMLQSYLNEDSSALHKLTCLPQDDRFPEQPQNCQDVTVADLRAPTLKLGPSEKTSESLFIYTNACENTTYVTKPQHFEGTLAGNPLDCDAPLFQSESLYDLNNLGLKSFSVEEVTENFDIIQKLNFESIASCGRSPAGEVYPLKRYFSVKDTNSLIKPFCLGNSTDPLTLNPKHSEHLQEFGMKTISEFDTICSGRHLAAVYGSVASSEVDSEKSLKHSHLPELSNKCKLLPLLTNTSDQVCNIGGAPEQSCLSDQESTLSKKHQEVGQMLSPDKVTPECESHPLLNVSYSTETIVQQLMEQNAVDLPEYGSLAPGPQDSMQVSNAGHVSIGMVSTAPLRAVFHALDQDGDGFVRIEEFLEFAAAYGAEQVKDLTRFLDPSGLGIITFEDFHRGITAISNGGSHPGLQKVGLNGTDAVIQSDEYDEAEVSESLYLGSESAYSECETFTDEDTGTLAPPELHEDVETDSGIGNTLNEGDDLRNRFSLETDLQSHAFSSVIGGEEEHFEDFGESNISELLSVNQEQASGGPEETDDPALPTHPGNPSCCPPALPCTSGKRLSSKKAARLLQNNALGLDIAGDLTHRLLDLTDSDLSDKVMMLERRVCELEQDSVQSEEQHGRLRQENLTLVHRANALEEQLKDQELQAEEQLQLHTRKLRDALSKLQRDQDLEIENLQARLHLLDEENNELRLCVPCLRANIERLEEEKQKLQDEVEDMSLRLNEELDARRKMSDKLSHDRHSNQKEKECMQELIEDLRKQLEHLQLFKLEMEAKRGRSPSAGLQEYNARTREQELEQEIRRLKQDNHCLKEQNDELNGQIINLSIQGAKSLVSESFSESLAAEINSVSRSELMEAIHKQEEINLRLQDYIDRIIVAIMESNPSILEVK